jgi:DNA/RNA endonuclease YhcR with UshA esterase domain
VKTLRHSLFLALLLASWPSTSLQGQTTTVIHDTEAIEHLGQYVTVEGTVVAVFTSKNGNTFLSFGAAYPNQTFAGWILRGSELAGVSTPADLAGLAGKKLRITGTIELYKGKPEIRISSTKQIQQDED